MAVSKDKLVFDPANASEGDKIATYLYSASGTLITHTTVSGKEALDVNVANSISVDVDLDAATDSVASWTHDGAGNVINSTSNALHVLFTNTSLAVTATNLDIRDLTHVSDSVKIGDGTDFLAVNTDGSINITDNGGSITVDGTVAATQSGSWTVAATQSGTWTIDSITNPVTVTATNLDIRDLAFASDSVTAHQGGSWTVTATATNFDIRDLTHVSDSVKIGDGTDFMAVNTDGSINVLTTSDPALANTGLAAAAASVTNTAAAIPASNLANRKYLFLQNLGNRSIYIGGSGVNTSTGFRLSSGATMDARIGAAVSVYAITDSGTQDVRLLELA
jgi:hypothetical protein